jgi:hypothetical protein
MPRSNTQQFTFISNSPNNSLVWSFADLLKPQYILEVPGILTTFAINPHDPNLVAGGLQSGQVRR